MFTYPAKITKDIDVYLVSFRDFYGDEPVTQEESYEDALNIASDWLVTEASMAVERHENFRNLLKLQTVKSLSKCLFLLKLSYCFSMKCSNSQ